jgi:hypothetical protein
MYTFFLGGGVFYLSEKAHEQMHIDLFTQHNCCFPYKTLAALEPRHSVHISGGCDEHCARRRGFYLNVIFKIFRNFKQPLNLWYVFKRRKDGKF